ncbi:aminoglycoside phosphotransferase [Sorangium cellulosum]|uniref:Aminoglycoside phosphotransferase n=2 Tax=Sorangium cellulosum TaxID=56 RepID=A0A2L0EZA4_SORCE|nr:aminoglycoside phosphotransferase [Sorangium cellulosum]
MRDGLLSESELARDLVRIGRSLAEDAGAPGDPVVLSGRADGLVVRVGGVVVKAHAPEADAGDLGTRLRLAASAPLRSVLLPPLALRPSSAAPPERPARSSGVEGDGAAEGALAGLALRVRGRLVTAWPAGEPVDPEDPDAAPWEEAARLLARLHATPLPAVAAAGRLPRAGAPYRVLRAMARLRTAARTPAAIAVEEAFASLPPPASGATAAPAGQPGARWRAEQTEALLHGDFHLGQVIRVADPPQAPQAPHSPHALAAGAGLAGASGAGGAPSLDPRAGPRAGGFRLIDVDDLGTGDPAWDLARPAAWLAAGLLPPEVWWRFLSAYRAAGGRAVPAEGDVWPALDAAARALAVQSAALAVASAGREARPLDEVEEALVDACRRMVRVDRPPDV